MATMTGYTHGNTTVASSPLSMDEFDRLKETVLFDEEDARYLRMAGEVLGPQVDDILDVWYGFVGSHSHLLYYFTDGDGNPLPGYLDAVRERFGRWIHDLCTRSYDEDWLDYQHEIALRHHRTAKNSTDGVASVPIIHLRYLIAFIYPITATIRPFLAAGEHSDEEVEKMHQAWFKAVVLSVTLWSAPYAKAGDF